jgi:hypothetical protein
MVSRHRVYPEEQEMPKLSRETAPNVQDMGVMEGRYGALEGYAVGFEHFREDARTDGLFDGLPDDRCQCPHWGYVFSGSITFRWADHEEVYEAGDAYYAPPGHLTTIAAGTEAVEFAPAEEHARSMETLGRNLAAMQAAG